MGVCWRDGCCVVVLEMVRSCQVSGKEVDLTG